MEESSSLTTAIMESLDGVRVVKMENKEAFEEARVADVIARRQKHIIAGADARAMAAPVSELMVMVMLGAGDRLCRLALPARRDPPRPVPDQAGDRRLVHRASLGAADGPASRCANWPTCRR